MEPSHRRAFAAIDLNAILHNFQQIRTSLRPGCRILSVIKADAYGHGALQTAQTLSESDYFGVACVDEAIALREQSIETPILILGYTSPREAQKLVDYRLTQCVFSSDYLRTLSEQLRNGESLTVHLKVDTGMSRLGFYAHDMTSAKAAAKEISVLMRRCKNIVYEGIFTHFTSSEERDPSPTRQQLALFEQVLQKLHQEGISFPLRHAANSGAILYLPETHLDMVRPGLALYGHTPDGAPPPPLDLRPAMELKSYLAQIRRIAPGDTISYGRTFRAETALTVGTVCMGYADGLPRALSNGGPVLINGVETHILGRVCMDQCVVNLTNLTANEGDCVTFLGTDGTLSLTPSDLAAFAGTISYEILCNIGKRIPRIYHHS